MERADRRWVVSGSAIALVGVIALVVVLTTVDVGSLDQTALIALIATIVVGLALIAAAGARDALLNDEGAQSVPLADAVDPGEVTVDRPQAPSSLRVGTVYRNRPEGIVFRTRYEIALLTEQRIRALRVNARAPSIVGVRADPPGDPQSDAGREPGVAWVTLLDPPLVVYLDVLTDAPEEQVVIGGSVG
jgi:hypothetical protein